MKHIRQSNRKPKLHTIKITHYPRTPKHSIQILRSIMITQHQLRQFLSDTESYHIERTSSTDNADKFCQAICAFSNDISGSEKNGYLIIGAHDNGELSGLQVDEKLLLQISNIRTDGNILPQPLITVEKFRFDEGDILVAEVQPSKFPPVRYRVQKELVENGNGEASFDFSLNTAFKVVEKVSEKYFEMGFGVEDSQEHPKNTRKNTRKSPGKAQEKPKKSPRNIQEEIVNIVRLNPLVTREELAVLTGRTPYSIKYHLRQLTANGIIKHEGATKAGKWIICVDFNDS